MLSPALDTLIASPYSGRTLEHRAKNKAALQELCGWNVDMKQPVIAITTGMTEALGGQLLEAVLPGLLELPLKIVILGRGSKKYGELFGKVMNVTKGSIAVVPDTEAHQHLLLAGADAAIFFTTPETKDVLACLAYGSIPVSPEHGHLENYNPVQERGNAFTFKETTPWQCFAAVVRALETLRFPYDWKTIQRNAMESVGEDTGTPEE